MKVLVSTLLFIVLSLSQLSGQTILSKVSPPSEKFLFDSEIVFEWNSSTQLGIIPTYSFLLASDSLLNNVVYSRNNLSQLKDTVIVPSVGKYFWQLTAFDQSNRKIAESAIFNFTYADINTIAPRAFHFRSDTGIVTDLNNNVSKWLNIADTTKSAIALSTASSPALVTKSEINNNFALSFDGIDDVMEVSTAVPFYELFVVANWGGASQTFPNFNGLISGKSNYQALVGNGVGGNKTDLVNSGVTANLKINGVLTRDFAPLSQFKIMSSYRPNVFNAIDMQLGRDRHFTTRYWNGNIAEVIGFSSPLNDSLRTVVNAYLCQKFGKDFSFGKDILANGSICDTLLTVDSSYISYQWSNGDTTNFSLLSIGQSLSLEVVDSFGCRYADDIQFDLPVGRPIKNLLCDQDSIVWNPGLLSNAYSFQWSDNSTDSILVIKNGGVYGLTVTDNNNCTYSIDSILISKDSSFMGVDLGNDTTLCSGDFIALKNANDTLFSYQWSTGDTSSNTQVQSAGKYYITVDNKSCLFVDSILITIAGQAPSVSFSANNLFTNDSAAFQDLTVAIGLDTIVEWLWDFGDGNSSIVQNPKHVYLNPGQYDVALSVKSKNGCSSSLTKKVTVITKPPTTIQDSNNRVLTLVSPNKDEILYSNSIELSWNNSIYNDTSNYYRIEVSSDSTFSALIYSDTSFNHTDTLILSRAQSAYWKVSLIDTSGIVLESEKSRFTYVNMYDVDGMNLFFTADSGLQISSNNQINTWKNLADTTINLMAPSTAAEPLSQVTNELKTGITVKFDGVDDFMFTDSSLQLSEIFTIAKWSNGSSSFPSYNGLLGGKSTYFLIAADGSISNSTRFQGGSFGNNMSINKVSTRDFAPIDEYKVIRAFKSTPGFYPDFQVARDRTFSSRLWNGEVAEILGFENLLSDSLENIVESYICNKYANPLELGEDIAMSYGFCDTMLVVSPNYKTYLWSNGDTTNFSRLLPGKSYELTVTDDYGCEFMDRIAVQLPVKSESDQLLCLKDTFIWDTGLDSDIYRFRWSDGSSDSALSIHQAGHYFVIIEDSLGCSIQMDSISISYDSSLIALSLGPDTAICKGDIIRLDQPSLPISSYLWSTGSSISSIAIDTTGVYSLRVSNGRCFQSDSIQVSIKGEAPYVNFNATDLCAFDSVLFTDASVPFTNDTLSIWEWDFNDGTTQFGDSIRKQFVTAGDKNVSLTVKTKVGCSADTTIKIRIDPKPTASFEILNNCSKSQISFTNQSRVSTGSISSYSWNFGDSLSSTNSSTAKDPIHFYDTLGSYLVSMMVESDKGCKDTIHELKYINPTPDVDFAFSGLCDSDSTFLIDQTVLPNAEVLDYLWIITLPNAQPLTYFDSIVELQFSESGSYPVLLRVRSDSLCSAIHRDTIVINNSPVANFEVGTFCLNQPFVLNDLSTIVNDSISNYQYIFNRDTSNFRNAQFLSDTTGSFDVKLTVESTAACLDSVSKTIVIEQDPTSDFKVLNNNTGIPFEVALENRSLNASNYFWLFGNGDSLEGFEPNYTYQDTGSYQLSLIAETANGCRDTSLNTLTALPYYLDANLFRLFLNETSNNELEVSALIQNLGHNTINELVLGLNINDEVTLNESFDLNLFNGKQELLTFNSKVSQALSGKVNFVCVNIAEVNQVMDDSTENNRLCEKGFTNNIFLDYFPNPTDGQVTMNYTLPSDGEVTIELFDRLGKQVLPTINSTQPEGYYSILLNTEELQAGVYLFRFIFNGAIENGVIIKNQ